MFDDEEMLFYLSQTKTMSVLAFIMLLTVAKNLNSSNYAPWFEERIFTFAGAIGAADVVNILKSNMFPPMDNINRCQGVFSSSEILFSTFFEEIHSTAMEAPSFIQSGIFIFPID